MRSLGLLGTVVAAALTLAGCAESFNAQVNRFNAMPAAQGQSFVIHTNNPKLAGGLEFNQYAALVTQKLVAQGYQPAASAEAASLVVDVDYGVDKGKTVRTVDPYVGFGGYGGWGGYGPWGPYYGGRHRGYWGGYAFGYDPFLFNHYGADQYTVYTSGLDMVISQHANGQHVFEGHAKAVSSSNTLSILIPNLVDAMFTNFPGKSGETVKITIAPLKK